MSSEPHLRRRPGPPPRLSRELIAEAAIVIGFNDLTLASVAERLSATHAALYRHVADRDDLVVAAVERLVAELPPPIGAMSWRNLLEAETWALWDMYASNPGVDQVLCAVPAAREVFVSRTIKLIRRLCEAGFDVESAVLVTDIVVDFARASGGTAARLHRTKTGQVKAALTRAWSDPGDMETLRLVTGLVRQDHRPWAARKLEVVLDGIASSVPCAANCSGLSSAE